MKDYLTEVGIYTLNCLENRSDLKLIENFWHFIKMQLMKWNLKSLAELDKAIENAQNNTSPGAEFHQCS